MNKSRTILHCDMNNFFASCECKLNPELKKVPMAVVGDMEARKGIVLAKNELAKAYGVITAETVWAAKRKCPNLTLVSPHKDIYSHYSKKFRNICYEFTDMVEPFGIDECYLDVTDSSSLFGDGITIAEALRKKVKEELGLTVSIGVSFNKAFAKLGSDYKKPDAVTVISKENYADFINDMPVESLLLVGGEIKKRLNRMGIKTIGELARENRNLLVEALGKIGGTIYDYANGLDDSIVEKYNTKHKLKSVGNGNTFPKNISSREELFSEFMKLCEEIAGRLRNEEQKGNVICLNLKTPDFKTKSKQKTIESATNLATDIYRVVTDLYKESFLNFGAVRAATITVKGLNLESESSQQLSMFFEKEKKNENSSKIEDAMYNIKNKYGFNSITYGVTLKNNEKEK